MSVIQAFDDIAEILAQLDPAKVVQLKADPAVSERVEVLVQKKKNAEISQEEILELERFLALDLLISLAKARAQRLLRA